MSTLFLVNCFILLFCIAFFLTKPARNFPKGPKGVPIINNLLILSKLKKYRFHHMLWHSLSKTYGDVVGLKFFNKSFVIVSGKEWVRKLYRHEKLQGRPDAFFFAIRTFGERRGIVFTDGELWESQRTLSVRILRTFGFGKSDMLYNIQLEAQDLIRMLKTRVGQRVAVQEENKNIFDIPVINVIWKMIKGERFELNDEKAVMLMETIHKSFSIVDMSGGVLSFFPALRHVFPSWSGYRPLVSTMQVLWDFLSESIDEVWNSFESGRRPRSFIEFYIEENFHSFDKKELLALLLDFFQAGSETTSNTLSFALLYMLHYPEVKRKVQDEIDVKLQGKFPTLNDRNILKYTDSVLCEIQRMSNVAPLGIAHRALEDVELDNGDVIPKNATILFSLYSVHMDEGYWGDPHSFRPERFLGGDEIISHESFIPFGAGKRRCVGENLAKSSLFIFFVALMQEFDVNSSGKLSSLQGRNGITLTPDSYEMMLKMRNNKTI